MARIVEYAGPDLAEEDVETLVADICAEVERRAAHGGDLYPFGLDLHGVRRRDVSAEAERLYRFLLLCSVVPDSAGTRAGFQPGRVFERIAAVALAQYTTGKAVVFADMPDKGVRGEDPRVSTDAASEVPRENCETSAQGSRSRCCLVAGLRR